MKKIAFLFPGQGSQYVGMGKDIFENFPYVKEIFEQVDEVCKKSISRLCFEGPIEDLTLTENLQPAITAVSLACLSVIKAHGISPYVSAGHSLGEYSALVSAEVISSYDALRLVQKRGELMHKQSMKRPGGMVAIIGLSIEEVQEVVEKAKSYGIISVANHNTEEQIVITGENKPLKEAVKIVKEKKAKAIPLKVSGAWHCELMNEAATQFREFIKEIRFERPTSKIIFNATAKEEEDPEKIKELMVRQLISPVRWYDSMRKMINDGVDIFVEIGPKKVLSGLLKKIDKKVSVYNVEDSETLRRFLDNIL